MKHLSLFEAFTVSKGEYEDAHDFFFGEEDKQQQIDVLTLPSLKNLMQKYGFEYIPTGKKQEKNGTIRIWNEKEKEGYLIYNNGYVRREGEGGFYDSGNRVFMLKKFDAPKSRKDIENMIEFLTEYVDKRYSRKNKTLSKIDALNEFLKKHKNKIKTLKSKLNTLFNNTDASVNIRQYGSPIIEIQASEPYDNDKECASLNIDITNIDNGKVKGKSDASHWPSDPRLKMNFNFKEEECFDKIYDIALKNLEICKENNRDADKLFKEKYFKEKTKQRTVTNYDRSQHTYTETTRNKDDIEREIENDGYPTIVARLVIAKIIKQGL